MNETGWVTEPGWRFSGPDTWEHVCEANKAPVSGIILYEDVSIVCPDCDAIHSLSPLLKQVEEHKVDKKQRVEYLCIDLRYPVGQGGKERTERLNVLAADGWSLFCIDNDFAYLSRGIVGTLQENFDMVKEMVK